MKTEPFIVHLRAKQGQLAGPEHKLLVEKTIPLGTLAVVPLESGDFKIAGAMCSGNDNFCYKTGRTKAVGQLNARNGHSTIASRNGLAKMTLDMLLREMGLFTTHYRRMDRSRRPVMETHGDFPSLRYVDSEAVMRAIDKFMEESHTAYLSMVVATDRIHITTKQ